jgi:hypothetical protein
MRKLTILIGFVVAFTTNWTRTATRQGSDDCARNVGLDLRDTDPKVLREVERRWIEAYGQRNTQLLACILADDFEIGSMPDSKLEVNSRQHVLDWVSTKAISMNQMEHLDISTHGTVAVARGIYSVSTPDGRLTSRFQFSDVFAYRRNGWQALLREIATLPVK